VGWFGLVAFLDVRSADAPNFSWICWTILLASATAGGDGFEMQQNKEKRSALAFPHRHGHFR